MRLVKNKDLKIGKKLKEARKQAEAEQYEVWNVKITSEVKIK